VDRSSPSVAQSAADVSAALTPRAAEISADIYHLIVREIPQLRGDKRVLALLEASVGGNVTTLLHVMQHGIDLEQVQAPAAAQEYARRLAQRGVPIAALLRAYRIGSARFQDWCLEELGRSTDNASVISAAGLRIADATATYIDRVSEELVSAYEAEKENWVRNLSAARAARVRALLSGGGSTWFLEAILGYGCGSTTPAWGAGPRGRGRRGALARPEQAIVTGTPAGCEGGLFLPGRDQRVGRAPAGAREPSPSRPPAPAPRGQQPGSGSPSALPARASPASAAPTSRRWARMPSRWPVGRRARP
jgi:hypothetical protein